MKKLIYPLLAAVLLAPVPLQAPVAEAAPQTVKVETYRQDERMDEAIRQVHRKAVAEVLEGFLPAEENSREARRIRRRVLREYNKYVLHMATKSKRNTQKFTCLQAEVQVDRDALAQRVGALQAAAKDSSLRACFLLQVTGALDKAAAEQLLQQGCAEQYGRLGLRSGSNADLTESHSTQLTAMSPERYDRFTNYMLDKLDQQWLGFQLALIGDVDLSTVPGEGGVTRRARVRLRTADADAHRVVAELLQEYTATAATEAEAERLVLQQAVEAFAPMLGARALEELEAQDKAEDQAAAQLALAEAKAKKKQKK